RFLQSCGKSLSPFPKHLTIGRLKNGVTQPYDIYRTVFFNVPPFDAQDHHLNNARMLFRKMLLLLCDFTDPSLRTWKTDKTLITPDGSAMQLLSDRSIPYYYSESKQKTELLPVWNPEKTLRGRQADRPGYFSGTYSSVPYIISPLNYSILDKPLLRVEGIAGKRVENVRNDLIALKKERNLNFDVLLVKLEADAADPDTSILSLQPDPRESDHCMFDDLQADYLLVRNEIICCVRALQDILCKEMSAPVKYDKIIFEKFSKLFSGKLTLRSFSGLTAAAKKTIDAFGKAAVPSYVTANYSAATFLQLSELVTKMCSLSQPVSKSIVKRLPNLLADFDYEIFLKEYKQLQHFVIQYRSYFEIVLEINEQFFYDTEMTVSQEIQYSGYRDIINRLRWLDCSCIYPKLGILRYLRDQRIAAKTIAPVFSQYAKEHCGLEHYAGVPQNGTLLLVYSKTNFYDGTINPVVADFALPGICCSPCLTDTKKELQQPLIALDSEITILQDDLLALGTDGLVIDVLSNDYYLARPLLPVADVVLEETDSPDDFKNTGSISIDTSAKRAVVVYKNEKADPTVDFFLLSVRNPETKEMDYCTLRVIVETPAFRLINTHPDKAATLVGRKVNIDLLSNDNSWLDWQENITVTLVKSDGSIPEGDYLSEKGNLVTLDTDGVTAIFDSSNTPGTISDTVTDRFYYLVTDKSNNRSVVTYVEVDILACCGSIIFQLPRLQYCKNSPPDNFTIDADGADPSTLYVDGKGASLKNGQWQFDPSSTEVKTGIVPFKLFESNKMKKQLATFQVTVNQAVDAAFTYTTSFPNDTAFGVANCTVSDRSADLYEWFIEGSLVGEGPTYAAFYYIFASYNLTLVTRKIFGTDNICTSQYTSVIGRQQVDLPQGTFNTLTLFDANNSTVTDLASNKTFSSAAGKSDKTLITDLKKIGTTMQSVLTDTSGTTSLVAGTLDGSIAQSGQVLTRLKDAMATVTDTKVLTSAQDTSKALAMNTLLAMSMRNPSVAENAPMTDTVGQIGDALTVLADTNAASFTADDRNMLAHAYTLASGQPELQKMIAGVQLKLQ
ncbi:MAG TPA: hypothetical protein VFU15_11445, partial [Bacteroidia bacterium]|nr:hypothetical protein [Bacteroidia bacterium]